MVGKSEIARKTRLFLENRDNNSNNQRKAGIHGFKIRKTAEKVKPIIHKIMFRSVIIKGRNKMAKSVLVSTAPAALSG